VASIASVYVYVLPVTGKIAEGIARALLSADDDVRKAGARWRKIVEKEFSDADATVDIDADTKAAKAKIDRLDKDKHTAHVRVDVDDASDCKICWLQFEPPPTRIAGAAVVSALSCRNSGPYGVLDL
jgi:hypothetical protein